MIQKVYTQEFLFILDTDTEWDGHGCPHQARKVWQCRLDNPQELPAYEAKHDQLKADFERHEREKAEEKAYDEALEKAEKEKADKDRIKAEADRLAKIANL